MAGAKVAAVSGDVRRALQICGRAAELAAARLAAEGGGGGPQRVGIPDVNKAAREFGDAAHLAAVGAATPPEALALVGLCLELKNTGRDSAPLDALLSKVRRWSDAVVAVARCRGRRRLSPPPPHRPPLPPKMRVLAAAAGDPRFVCPKHSESVEMIERLADARVLLLDRPPGRRLPTLRLNMDNATLVQRLGGCVLVKKFLSGYFA